MQPKSLHKAYKQKPINKEKDTHCNEPQKLNKKLLGFIICIKNIQLKNGYKPYKNA